MGTELKRVLLNVDGVIADFTAGYRVAAMNAIGRTLPEHTTDWHFTDWGLTPEETKATIERVKRPDFALNLAALPGAVEAVKLLSEMSDVYFVTSSWDCPTWAYDHKRWLQMHFGHELGAKFVSTECKHICAGDVFVDDKPDNVRKWSAAQPGKPILWDAPYNRSAVDLDAIRCNSWVWVLECAR